MALMARVMYFDCFAGAAGDMVLGAFLDAGLPLDALQQALGSLGVGHELKARKCSARTSARRTSSWWRAPATTPIIITRLRARNTTMGTTRIIISTGIRTTTNPTSTITATPGTISRTVMGTARWPTSRSSSASRRCRPLARSGRSSSFAGSAKPRPRSTRCRSTRSTCTRSVPSTRSSTSSARCSRSSGSASTMSSRRR